MFATLICVFTLDRIGRRMTLFWGSIVQGIVLFLAGGFSRLGLNATESGNTSAAGSYGIAAASMIVIFTATFGATWLTVPWLYPAEIFPLAVRARGNALGVVGWSIGNGWLLSLISSLDTFAYLTRAHSCSRLSVDLAPPGMFRKDRRKDVLPLRQVFPLLYLSRRTWVLTIPVLTPLRP
jgi:hypothetical protein